jgi:phosphatidylglycerophosphatase A
MITSRINIMAESVPARPGWRQLLHDPVLFAAFGFGAGMSPKAPGTVGTLAAVPLYLGLLHLSPPLWWGAVIAMSLLGIWICGRAARRLGIADHPGIVWDEIVGFLLTMSAAGFSWINLLAGFVLFRLFDIAKPWPISWLDRNIKGGLGIMLDDIAADRCRQFNSWDRFIMPKWGARLCIMVGEPICVQKGLSMNDLEPLRLQLQQKLMDLTAAARHHLQKTEK